MVKLYILYILLLFMDFFSLGIAFVVIGLLMLIAEMHTPGFFIAVPGTVFIIFGIVLMLMGNRVTLPIAVAVILITSVVTTILVMLFYKKLGEGKLETTTTLENLVGKEGIVVRRVGPDNLKGKVKIDGEVWSATADRVIPEGRRVVIIKGEGVHIIVREKRGGKA